MTWIKKLFQSEVFKNSFWGIFSNVIQNVFVAVFFVILARKYNPEDFGQYLVANGLYQLFAVLSNLGLSQWFIREVVQLEDKKNMINQFFKIQLYFGLLFFVINLIFSFSFYDNKLIHILAVIFGFNIIFDNIIYGIRALNIAEFQQKKTFIILIVEAFLRLLIACLLFIYPFSIATFCIFLILIRVVSLNLFLKIGSSSLINFKSILRYPLQYKDIQQLIYKNWPFIIIGSVSLLYWRSASIIISKMLTLADVAVYEITYKIFAIAQIVPMMISTTVFPAFVRIFNEGDAASLHNFYRQFFIYYFLYGLLSYTFIYSFADDLMPFIFGSTYQHTPIYTKQMFLTMLVFPTALLQANLLVAMTLEKFDMWFNVASLIINMIISIVGIYYFHSLSVINYAIFASFIVFHLSQDVLLIRRGISTVTHVVSFYAISTSIVLLYFLMQAYIKFNIIAFVSYWALVIGAFLTFTSTGKSLVKQLLLKQMKVNRIKN